MSVAGSECPTSNCVAESPKQEAAPLSLLSGVGAAATWTGDAFKCSACQCVYTIDGDKKVMRGYLGNAVLGAAWSPIFA